MQPHPRVGCRATRTDRVSLPFSSLRLKGPRPHALPRGYPIEVKTLRTPPTQMSPRSWPLATNPRPAARRTRGNHRALGKRARPTAPKTVRQDRPVSRLRPRAGDLTVAGRLPDRPSPARPQPGRVRCQGRFGRGQRVPLGEWQPATQPVDVETRGGNPGPPRVSVWIRTDQTTRPFSRRQLTYFDRTRWRRRPPPDLTKGEPISLGDRIPSPAT